jgi:hypothetical protein
MNAAVLARPPNFERRLFVATSFATAWTFIVDRVFA